MDHFQIVPRQLPGGGGPMMDPSLLPHDSWKVNIIVSSVICYAIAVVFVVARVYTRKVMMRIYDWDDTCLIISLVIAGVCMGAQIEGSLLGLGSHIWDVPPQNQGKMMIVQFYSVIAYLFTTFFAKLSVLILYRSIFAQASSANRWANYIVTGLVVLQTIWVFVCLMTACIPLEAYWNPMITEKWCWPDQLWTFNNSTHLISDFFIFLLPLPMLRQLNVPRRQRIFLFLIFSVGFFVCFVSIIRLIILARAQTDPILLMDYTYNLVSVSYWNSIEINLGIVVACLMTLRPLAARFMPKIFASTVRSRTGGSNRPSAPRPGFAESSTKAGSRNRRGGGGELTNFENDIWLEAQSHKGASDASTVVGSAELATKHSKSTLDAPLSPVMAESDTGLHPPPAFRGASFLGDVSERSHASSLESDEKHTSGFLESASDEEGLTRDETNRPAETRVYITR